VSVPEWSSREGAPVFLLVRPDRYLAAAFTTQGAAGVLSTLSRWFIAPGEGAALREMEIHHA
jgi:hypothetical protein